MTNGVILLVARLILSLTGAAIAYKDITNKILRIEDLQTPPAPKLMQSEDKPLTLPNYKERLPDSQWLTVSFPRQKRQDQENENKNKNKNKPKSGNPKTEGTSSAPKDDIANTLTLRLRAPSNWFGLANSIIEFEAVAQQEGKVTLVNNLYFGEKLYNILVPLHTGRNLSAAYVFVLMAFSLLGTIMVLSGLVSIKNWT